GHAGLDGGVQAGERLVEKRQAEELVGSDLAGERDGVAAEGGAQVGGFGGGRGKLGHRDLPLVVDERGGVYGKPPSGQTTGAKTRAKAIWAALRGEASASSGGAGGGTQRRETALCARSTGASVTSLPSWTADSAPESRCLPTVISVPA